MALKVVITVDVEEEGLFSGQYPRTAAGVVNVKRLRQMERVSKDYGLPFTLLINYPVAMDKDCAAYLKRWRDEFGAEIGAHLHPWNTPPFGENIDELSSAEMPAELLKAKLSSLRRVIKSNLGCTPVSFRMGRWDFSDTVRDVLLEEGFLIDASVVPLKKTPAGAKYFSAPTDPFWLKTKVGMIAETPLTLVPILPTIAKFFDSWGRNHLPSLLYVPLLQKFSAIGAVGVQPVWYSLAAMKLAAKLHLRREGEVLNIFFHSSELLPGASPHFPTEKSVTRFVAKLCHFFDWLGCQTEYVGLTLSDLRGSMLSTGKPNLDGVHKI